MNRAGHQDYGGTVLLRHETGDGDWFYTLYGHLDPASITGLAAGDNMSAGQQIGTLGASDVNGGWQPHLHFQMAHLLPDETGAAAHDWPGVADPDDLAWFAALYPNPAALLGLDPARMTYPIADPAALAGARADRLGPI